MCGRFTLTSPADQISDLFDLVEPPSIEPRYNIAPTQEVCVVLGANTRSIRLMRWGLVPTWAEDLSFGSRCINARSETVASKPAFRSAYRHRRCLIPANGFYEWKSQGGSKQPYYIGLAARATMAFAGLWESWTDPISEASVTTCTILTTTANPLLEPLHDRMPVILPPQTWQAWMDPDTSRHEIDAFLTVFPADLMTAYPVSELVGAVANDSPDLIERIAPAQLALF